jgi:hypothetical protein
MAHGYAFMRAANIARAAFSKIKKGHRSRRKEKHISLFNAHGRRLAVDAEPAIAKNLILSGGGKRIAQGPPAVKPPETTVSAFTSVRMSEKGSSDTFERSRK